MFSVYYLTNLLVVGLSMESLPQTDAGKQCNSLYQQDLSSVFLYWITAAWLRTVIPSYIDHKDCNILQ